MNFSIRTATDPDLGTREGLDKHDLATETFARHLDAACESAQVFSNDHERAPELYARAAFDTALELKVELVQEDIPGGIEFTFNFVPTIIITEVDEKCDRNRSSIDPLPGETFEQWEERTDQGRNETQEEAAARTDEALLNAGWTQDQIDQARRDNREQDEAEDLVGFAHDDNRKGYDNREALANYDPAADIAAAITPADEWDLDAVSLEELNQ